ncbi:deoxyuridine 5'-triphosphate nucleotidohydrolase-like [Phyllobates terribilis]|uniref:deoxyuridine 5'-triphosphate nucleotidohydrolase-like n=1 Tax=Phyllobates terribilis TaxID=111132 RepID=UPI003CCA8EF2
MITPNLQIMPLKATTTGQTVLYWELEPGALGPYRDTPQAAGLDLHSHEEIRLEIGVVKAIRTAIGLQMPPEHFGLIAPRSGLALRGIQVMGGVIDQDYQDEIKVLLLNSGDSDLLIQKGDWIAQLLILSIQKMKIIKGTAPAITVGGDRGFGSTHFLNDGAKIWVQQPGDKGPPEPAEVIAQGADNVLIVMKPGQEKWEHVPANKCYLRD